MVAVILLMVCVLTRRVAITVDVNRDTSLKRTANESVKVSNKKTTVSVTQLSSFLSHQQRKVLLFEYHS